MKTMENLKLQYQLSNGNWVSCDNPATQWEPARDRTEDFLLMCEKFNGMIDDKIVPIFRATRPLTRDEVLTALWAGRELRNDKNDGTATAVPAPPTRPNWPLAAPAPRP